MNDDLEERTIILNKTNSDGFLDFNNSDDLKQVIKALHNLKKDRNE